VSRLGDHEARPPLIVERLAINRWKMVKKKTTLFSPSPYALSFFSRLSRNAWKIGARLNFVFFPSSRTRS